MEAMLIDYVPQIPIFQNNNAQVFADRIKILTNGKYMPTVVLQYYKYSRLNYWLKIIF